MKLCTIVDFRRAVRNPAQWLGQLSDARMADDAAICRSTLTADCRMSWRGREWLLSAPISLRAMERAERAAAVLRSLPGESMASYRILRDEILVDAATGSRCDAIAELLPAATRLSEAVAGFDADRLQAALDDLAQRLRRADISHNNLNADNIVIADDGIMHAIRPHYATRGAGGDDKALAEIGRYIASHALPSCTCLSDTTRAYAAGAADKGSRDRIGNMFEERARIFRDGAYGFVDACGRTVIEPEYFWADDFREGRAAVQRFDGLMGLIDKTGREIIPAQYDIVEYDVQSGRSWVARGSRWARFDYSGAQLDPWREREQCDIEL